MNREVNQEISVFHLAEQHERSKRAICTALASVKHLVPPNGTGIGGDGGRC
jgi:hypothetical protein